MNISVEMPYGHGMRHAVLPSGLEVCSVEMGDAPPLPDPVAALHAGLHTPVGMEQGALAGIRRGDRVVLVVSDGFRHTGMAELLPALVESVLRRGVAEGDLTFLVATGVHRAPTEEEVRRILGEAVYARFRGQCHAHSADDRDGLVYVGRTSRGTPVWLSRRLVEADRVILTGTVVLHYFAGFGGGRKSIVPGLAGEKTIAANHSLNLHREEERLDPAVKIGRLAGNPVAEDMAEAARFCAVECIVNTVLNRENRISGLFVGDRDAAHDAACAFAAGMYAVPLPHVSDLVIASAGAARNFVQSHKALFNAYQALRPGGRMVFLTPAQEGLGAAGFREWLGLGTRHAVIRRLRENAEINGQTALSTLEKAPSAVMVTEMDGSEVTLTGARKAASFQEAVDLCLRELAGAGIDRPRVCLMPCASYTVPVGTV